MSRADLFQALEGNVVHLPAPKIFCQSDLELTAETPFFAMADAPMVLNRFCEGSVVRKNTEMMDVRLCFFHFWKKNPAGATTTVFSMRTLLCPFYLDKCKQ